MTDTPRLWDRRADETPKSYAAFLAYVALGARRSVREAARQYHSNTTATGEISSDEDTEEDQAFLAEPALREGQGRVAAFAIAPAYSAGTTALRGIVLSARLRWSNCVNIYIVIFSLMVAIGAYFVAKGLLGAAGFCGVIVTAAIAVAIVHNIDTFTSLGLKTGTVDVSVEVARVRDEIFAKAEEVQQLAEQSAAISAWVVSTANRLVGESFQEQLLQRRDELLAMLIDLDVAPERRIAIVMPITRAVANDYRMNILSEARHAVVDAISGTKQQVDAIIREIVAPLENPDQQTGLLELRRHAEQHNLKLEGFHSAVDRYGRFLEQNPDLVK